MEELLRILEKNARMPIEDIAAMLDKTPEEIAAMMDEAAEKGYIRGFETLVDWEQAGVNQVEAVIELRVTPHKARGFDDIGMTIAQFDEVDTVLLMEQYKELLRTVKTLPLLVTGNSMAPFLVDRRDTVYLSGIRRPLRRGDIVLYQRRSGAYILHRICRREGDTFTIAGDTTVYRVVGAGKLQTNDQDLEITPALAKNAADNAAITLGAAYVPNLVFHRNAIAFVTRPLVAPAGADSYTTSYNDISLRVVRDYDITTKREKLSVDILYGYKTVYPELSAVYMG